MLTAGDVQFEPPAKKIFSLTNSIAVLTAGDSSLQAQLLAEANRYVGKRIDTDRSKWILVVDVANFYRDTYINIRKELAEKEVLAPYGLDYKTFLSNQTELSENFVREVSYRLDNFTIEDAATIITGLDEEGAHIYVVMNDMVINNDNVGFTAVGSGSNHALSHLMLSGYSRYAPEAKAILTIHRAKKKSEVSPGVGKDTDMFAIAGGLGSFQMLEPMPQLDIVTDLDGFYENYKSEIDKLDQADEDKIKDYLKEQVAKNSQTQKATPEALEIKTAEEVKVTDNTQIKKQKNGNSKAPKKPKP